jgi:putative transcriptional regulator
MPIKWRLAAVMADRETEYKELARLTGLHPVTLSKLKNSRFMPPRLDRTTLEKLCKALDCQPGELLRYIPEPEEKSQNS